MIAPNSDASRDVLMKFCSILDNWYIKRKEELKGTGEHYLGIDKEKVKEKCCDMLVQLIDKYENDHPDKKK